jgi:tRNA-2-methylthio-N6-dimethylallyladenosine synthase
MGCMVEEHREKLFKRFPQLDLMVGTRNLRDLPRLIDEVRQNRTQVSKIQRDGISIEYTDMIKRKTRDHAWLPIMTGCDKVCTYCIVPTTRGSEVSMPARDVYREASRLVDEGVRRIMLLGQNVNSYNGIGTRFPQLLEMLCEIEGLGRISFTTSHPQDATEDLFQVIKRNSKISRRFHLPLQSASDRMLKRMKRLHRFSEYQEKLERLRQLVPDISITTDIITGFSGETDDDHNQTMKALRAIRYDGAYIFKYSIRPGTPAAKLSDNVPEEVKAERHAQLFELQKKIAGENSKAWFGRVVDAFVEQPGGREPGQMICWTNQEKKVLAQADPSMAGRFLKIRLESLRHETFGGVIVNAPVGATS